MRVSIAAKEEIMTKVNEYMKCMGVDRMVSLVRSLCLSLSFSNQRHVYSVYFKIFDSTYAIWSKSYNLYVSKYHILSHLRKNVSLFAASPQAACLKCRDMVNDNPLHMVCMKQGVQCPMMENKDGM